MSQECARQRTISVTEYKVFYECKSDNLNFVCDILCVCYLNTANFFVQLISSKFYRNLCFYYIIQKFVCSWIDRNLACFPNLFCPLHIYTDNPFLVSQIFPCVPNLWTTCKSTYIIHE